VQPFHDEPFHRLASHSPCNASASTYFPCNRFSVK
jgi:hypothetical protein